MTGRNKPSWSVTHTHTQTHSQLAAGRASAVLRTHAANAQRGGARVWLWTGRLSPGSPERRAADQELAAGFDRSVPVQQVEEVRRGRDRTCMSGGQSGWGVLELDRPPSELTWLWIFWMSSGWQMSTWWLISSPLNSLLSPPNPLLSSGSRLTGSGPRYSSRIRLRLFGGRKTACMAAGPGRPGSECYLLILLNFLVLT